ncbi:TPA: hypothetical protein ACGZ96_003542 [Elizabethkingia anophelis]
MRIEQGIAALAATCPPAGNEIQSKVARFNNIDMNVEVKPNYGSQNN